MKRFLASILIVLLSTGIVRADSNTLQNPTAGFTITKPEGWQTLSSQDVQESRGRVKMDDKELQKMVRERADLPLVAFAKYDLNHDDLNPSVQVLIRPLGKLTQYSPKRLLHMGVLGIKRAFGDFRYVEPIHDTQVDGLAAATMKAQYTLTAASGRRFAVLSRMWTVPRGNYMFMIAMSGPISGPDKSEKEFEQVLQSIRIEK